MNIFKNLFGGRKLSSFDSNLTRESLVQGGRIVIIDDEDVLLISELKKEGFAVDHDKTGQDLRNIENQIYDVAIIDYHGVGQRLGPEQGLALLKHIRRVSPRTRTIAYTSRSLTASESEFFRLSHSVLPKDWGLEDSLILIENELRKAFSKDHLFEALLLKLDIADQAEKERIRVVLMKALANKDETLFKDKIIKLVGAAGMKTAEIIIKHLFQIP